MEFSNGCKRYKTFLKELQSKQGLKDATLIDCELHRTNVRELGDALFLHPTLTNISLRGCRIGDAAASLLVALLRAHPHLTSADFSSNNISKTCVSEIITALESNVSVTQLDVGPDNVEAASGLLLRFSSSSPPTPDQIARIRALCETNTELRATMRDARPKAQLRKRNLAILPGQILDRFNLVFLDLSNNRFATFPSGILTLASLEAIIMNNNNLGSIPSEICQLTALKRIEFEANSLSTLPESLVLIPNLTTLSICKNRITAVPRFVGAMSKLTCFRSAGNPFMRLLPRSVTSSDEVWGVMAVLDYLRTLALKGEAKQDRIRVMIVGRESVGKTSLCQALTNMVSGRKTVRLNSSSSSSKRPPVATDGVDIHTLTDAEQHVSFSIWDLAGQELYQVTHTLFLISQSVYVISVNMTAPDDVTNIEYWLELLQARAGTPPVVFVGTHAELCSSAQTEAFRKFHTRWTPRFPFCRASYPVSSMTGHGLRDFKNACISIARENNWIGGLIPASYLALAAHLDGLRQNMRIPTLHLSRYTEIALQLGLTKEGMGAATKYLVNTGHALYFGELNTALREVLFLDPQWLPRVFATIITMKQTFVQHGMLSRMAMRQVWQAPAFPPDTHDQIVSLFEEFDFFYRLPDSDVILVPSLLPTAAPPPDQLDTLWPPADVSTQVSRIVELGFVPRGFIGRLLVSLLKAGWRMLLAWRWGWVIELGDTRLRGEMFDVTRSLWLHARGGRSRTEILHLLDAIEQNLTQMHHATYKYRVPCLHCIAAGRTAPNQMTVYALEDIEDITSIGLSVIRCQVDKEEVSIAMLCPDVAMSGIPRLSDTDIAPLEYVASGSFADVYRSSYKSQSVAVKQLLFDDDQESGDNFGELRREALLMHQLRHANLITLVGVMMNPPAIVMEYMHLGDLFNYLHSEEKIAWSLRVNLALDIAQGLAFLHAQNPQIVHRDIKSPNVLLTVVDKVIVAKVADIGSARPLGVLNSTFRTRAVDNPTWLAPEAMSLGKYGAPADVYAVGVICWELASRETFFGSCTFMWEIEDHIMAAHRPDIPSDVPDGFASVIRKCWAPNPEDRPTASEVVALLQTAIASRTDLARQELTDEEKTLIDSGSKLVKMKPGSLVDRSKGVSTPRAPLLRCGKTVAMLDECAEEELIARPMPTSRRVYERTTNTGDMLRELRLKLVQERERRSAQSALVLTSSQKERLTQAEHIRRGRGGGSAAPTTPAAAVIASLRESANDQGKGGSLVLPGEVSVNSKIPPRYRLQRTAARKELVPRLISTPSSDAVHEMPMPDLPRTPAPPAVVSSAMKAILSPRMPPVPPLGSRSGSVSPGRSLRPLPPVPTISPGRSSISPGRSSMRALPPTPSSSKSPSSLSPSSPARPRAMSNDESQSQSSKVLLRTHGTRHLADEVVALAPQLRALPSPPATAVSPTIVSSALQQLGSKADAPPPTVNILSASMPHVVKAAPTGVPSALRGDFEAPPLPDSDSFKLILKDISDAAELYRSDMTAKKQQHKP